MDFGPNENHPPYGNYYYQNNFVPPVPNKRSEKMETAAMILGIVSLTTCSCLYISIVCGALAIILALLSKGGENTMGSRAKIGLGLGIAGLVLTILLYTFAFAVAIETYGSLEGILRAYCDMYGFDFEELYGDLF